mmetsp:Transcript_39349/g.118841  ORF Transcript_39349/g.118841 Transcript_39349/m.118841 type:complete len:275 (+) Transcript_39349:467-1291(+)
MATCTEQRWGEAAYAALRVRRREAGPGAEPPSCRLLLAPAPACPPLAAQPGRGCGGPEVRAAGGHAGEWGPARPLVRLSVAERCGGGGCLLIDEVILERVGLAERGWHDLPDQRRRGAVALPVAERRRARGGRVINKLLLQRRVGDLRGHRRLGGRVWQVALAVAERLGVGTRRLVHERARPRPLRIGRSRGLPVKFHVALSIARRLGVGASLLVDEFVLEAIHRHDGSACRCGAAQPRVVVHRERERGREEAHHCFGRLVGWEAMRRRGRHEI